MTTDVHFPPLTADFQLGVSSIEERVDFWTPAFVTSADSRTERDFDVVGKLRPGVTIAQAQAEMEAIASRLAEAYPASNRGWGVRVIPLRNQVLGTTRTVVWLLSLCTGIVLLIACGNVGSLLLARGLARHQEMAIRAALGATANQCLANHLATNGRRTGSSADQRTARSWSPAVSPPCPMWCSAFSLIPTMRSSSVPAV